MDHFARLGVPRAFDLDGAALERAYVGLQSRLHPDRFATRPERERLYSAGQAVAVNEAYGALRDPLARARHLLALAGRAPAGATAATIDDPEVLAEAMATREALADADDALAIAAVAARNADAMAACRHALAAAFAAGDLDQAERLVLRLGYLDKLAGEVKRRRVALLGTAA